MFYGPCQGVIIWPRNPKPTVPRNKVWFLLLWQGTDMQTKWYCPECPETKNTVLCPLQPSYPAISILPNFMIQKSCIKPLSKPYPNLFTPLSISTHSFPNSSPSTLNLTLQTWFPSNSKLVSNNWRFILKKSSYFSLITGKSKPRIWN